jgi:hypothetical protein
MSNLATPAELSCKKANSGISKTNEASSLLLLGTIGLALKTLGAIRASKPVRPEMIRKKEYFVNPAWKKTHSGVEFVRVGVMGFLNVVLNRIVRQM